MYKDVAHQMKQLKDACALYQSFVGQMISSSCGETCLPVLQYIIGKYNIPALNFITWYKFHFLEHGNTTVYEWRYGEPPLRIEEPPLLIETEEAAESSDGVSFKIKF